MSKIFLITRGRKLPDSMLRLTDFWYGPEKLGHLLGSPGDSSLDTDSYVVRIALAPSEAWEQCGDLVLAG